MALGVRKHHVAGKIPVFGTQGVGHPRSQRWPTGDGRNTGVEVANGDFVAVEAGVHRTNQTDVIDDTSGVWEQFREFCATFAVAGKLPGAAEEFSAGPVYKTVDNFALIISIVEAGEFWLGVEQVDMRRTAVHKQRNHRLSPAGTSGGDFREHVKVPRLCGNFGRSCL